jgi:signal transduction histidine kinase
MSSQGAGGSDSAAAARILAGGGEMGALARELDWTSTPLGAVSGWPQSLRTAVSIVFESTFPMMLAWGPAFTQIYNDPFRPILGSRKHPALGKRTADTFAEAWHIVGPLFAQVVAGQGVGFHDMLVPLDRDGYLEECYFVYTYTPVRDESGGVGGLLVACTETTARVLAERRLRVLRELASAAAQAKHEHEAWSLAAAVLGDNGADLPFALLYGLERDGDTAQLLHPDASPWGPACLSILHDEVRWPLRRAVDAQAPQLVDDLIGRAGSHAGPAWPEPVRAAMIVPITRPGLSLPYGFLIAGISPRLALDGHYRDFLSLVGDQIAAGVANARAFEEEIQRNQALLELDRQKTAFFSNVSHELRTPLTLILGPLVEALQADGGVRDDVRPALESAHRNSQRLLRLVNTLLDFSRMEAGRMQARFERVDIGALTTDLASAFRSAMEKAGLELVIEADAIDEPVYVDRHMWEQIVLNLVSNAFKFTFHGGVTVSTRARGPMVEVRVRDTGVGIPEHALPHVFDRFRRVEGTRGRTHEGSGIGLALVHELVRLHGGTIAVESQVDHGTTFTLSWPTGSAHLPADSIASDAAAAPVPPSSAYAEEALRWLAPSDAEARDASTSLHTTGGRVLFVDDNADMRDYARRLLGAQWRVDTASDGLEALRVARERRPDVIVTDVMMPSLDGFGLLREVRADPALRQTAVILLSARAGDEARLEGLAEGADDYLVKPFSARDLVARVNVHVVKARVRASEQEHADRLAGLVSELAQAKESAETSNRLKDEFLATLSHELRTPLNAVLGYTQMLREGVIGEDRVPAVLETIERNARLQSQLIEDVLDVSRIITGKFRLDMQQVDLARVIDDAIETVTPAANAKGVRLQTRLDQSGVQAAGDAQRLQQVIWNLLSNAVKFTPRGGRVQVVLQRVNSHVEITVSDTGEGVDPKLLPHLFDRFWQADGAASRTHGGLGLGLALSRHLVEAHGGTIAASSPGKGQGMTVRIELPRVSVPGAAPETSVKSHPTVT